MIVHAEDAQDFWQPEPANGWIRLFGVTGGVASGLQEIPRLGKVREHAHPAQDEYFYVLEGEGLAKIGDSIFRTKPGTFFHIPPHVRHGFINAGDVPYRWFWWLSPPGLENFFTAIGRPKGSGLPDPTPYPRPADVVSVELGTVFEVLDPPSVAPWDPAPITDISVVEDLRRKAV